MKKIAMLFVLMMLCVSQAIAQGLYLEWNANDPVDEVVGYIVYFSDDDPGGDAMAITEFHKDVGNVTTVQFSDIPVPQDGKLYWYCVSAYNAFGESVGRSNIVTDTRPMEYVPPTDVLPIGGSVPSDVTGFIKT